jgi:CheY-like chemotaxis protein
MMTGLDDVNSMRRAFHAGATDFVTKPLDPALLEFRLRYLLRAAAVGNELRQSEALLATAQRIAQLGHFAYVPERGFSAWTVPIPGVTNPVPDIPFTWQPVVRGIEALELRGWLEGRGWLPAASLAASQASELAAEAARAEQLARAAQLGQAPQAGQPPQAGTTTPAATSVLVTGVELVLVRRGERIVRVFAVAD